jgi:uncharacterized membrane protein
MIRGVLRLGAVAVVAGWALDRVLRWRAGSDTPAPVSTSVVIDAPIDRVWSVVADIEGQPRWMHDMKSVRMTTPGPTQVGSRGEATVRMFGVGVTDPVTVTAFEPPTTFGIRHEGSFAGGGTFRLASADGGATTVVDWEERLAAPVLPHAAAVVTAPIFRRVFQADLDRLRDLIETGAI